MALPNSNISTSLVKSAIGAATNDVGSLCTHPNINKWSRWKPVRHFNITGINAADLKAVKYGLYINEFSTIQDVISFYESGAIAWRYDKPRGHTSLEYFRLGDFRTYDHDVRESYTLFKPNNMSSATTLPITYNKKLSHPSTGVTIEDLDLHTMCLGGAVGKNGTLLKHFTLANPISSYSDTIVAEIPIDGLFGIHQAYAFLAERNPIVPSNIDKYYAIENGRLGNFDTDGGNPTWGFSSTLTGMLTDNPVQDYTVTWELKLTNSRETPIIFPNCIVKVLYQNTDPVNGALSDGEQMVNLGSITVAAGQTETRNGTFNQVLRYYQTQGGKLAFVNQYTGLNKIYPLFEA